MTDPHAAQVDDEPRTPMWLPALGAAIFVGAALWWAVTPSSAAPPAEGAASASGSAAAAAAAPPAPRAGAPQPNVAATAQAVQPGRPVLAPGMASADTQERLRQIRERMKAPGGSATHP